MRKTFAIGVLTAGTMLVIFLASQPIFRSPEPGSDQVVLLHGLGRSESAMLPLENHLAGAGFDVHNIGYPSNDQAPEALIAHVAAEVRRCCVDNDRTVHFVGHSLGGLIIRAILEADPPPNLGRVVLLGTPNQGSELADEGTGLAEVFADYAGPTARALGTGADAFPASLGPPDYPVGVIAGTSGTAMTAEWLPEPNDGMVSVASARLAGMTDFLQMVETHWGLRSDLRVAEQTIHFLKHGTFDH